MATIPLLAWTVVAATVGARAPLLALALSAVVLPLLVAPQVLPDLAGRRRGRVDLTCEGRRVMFSAPATERYVYAVLAVLFLPTPWAVQWDAERISAPLPGQVRFWLLSV